MIALLLPASLPSSITEKPVSLISVQQRAQAACSFLKTLYSPTLQLVKEKVNSTTYYIASDNLLAQRALSTCDPGTSRAT